MARGVAFTGRQKSVLSAILKDAWTTKKGGSPAERRMRFNPINLGTNPHPEDVHESYEWSELVKRAQDLGLESRFATVWTNKRLAAYINRQMRENRRMEMMYRTRNPKRLRKTRRSGMKFPIMPILVIGGLFLLLRGK